MKDSALISAWLSGSKDYKTGVEIYRRLGENDFLKKIFASGADDWNKEKLLSELEDLLSSSLKAEQHLLEAALPASKAAISTLLNDELKVLSDRSDAPKEIKETIKKRKYLYASARDGHSQLKVLNTLTTQEIKEKRLALCQLILGNFNQIKPLWDMTNFYDSFGKLPENTVHQPVEFEQLDIKTLNQDWLNDYKYILKYKNDSNKKDKIKARIAACMAREEVLRNKDSFLHEGLSLPILTA